MIDLDPADAALSALGIDAPVRARLARYMGHLSNRPALNLTAARTTLALAEHVADSLAILPYLREPFVDVGSGGGFPAIPVAIVTGYRGTLIEATGKKARFLSEVIADLDLPLTVVAKRAEDAARDTTLRGAFACATARAVSNLSTVLELTVPFLETGGLAVLQRGVVTAGERAGAQDAALVLGARFEDEIALPSSRERRIVLVRKIAPTGQRFPRRPGIPAKRPLCYAAEPNANE